MRLIVSLEGAVGILEGAVGVALALFQSVGVALALLQIVGRAPSEPIRSSFPTWKNPPDSPGDGALNGNAACGSIRRWACHAQEEKKTLW